MPKFKCDIFGDFQILCVRGAANTKHDKLQHFKVIESNTFGQSIEASLERNQIKTLDYPPNRNLQPNSKNLNEKSATPD